MDEWLDHLLASDCEVTTVRFSEETIQRASGLVHLLMSHPRLKNSSFKSSRRTVLGLAVLCGLKQLEDEKARTVEEPPAT